MKVGRKMAVPILIVVSVSATLLLLLALPLQTIPANTRAAHSPKSGTDEADHAVSEYQEDGIKSARQDDAASPSADLFTSAAGTGRTIEQLVASARSSVPAGDENLRNSLDDLLSPDPESRAAAVLVVGFSDSAPMLEPVLYLLARDPSARVRAAAAAALDVHPGDSRVSLALVDALEDKSSEVRSDALLSLKAHRSGVVEEGLLRKLNGNRLDRATAQEAKLFLDRYYVQKDPFNNPLAP